MDRLAIARAERRRQATDELEFERDRAAALQEELQRTVLELEGPALDEEVFAKMDPEDVELVRGAIRGGSEIELDEELVDGDDVWDVGADTEQWAAEQREEQEAEIVRLQAEIAASERRQQALERYLEALGS